MNVMKRLLITCFCTCLLFTASAQDEEQEEGNGKKNFFTGGRISLSFFDGAFLVGANPVFGSWIFYYPFDCCLLYLPERQ